MTLKRFLAIICLPVILPSTPANGGRASGHRRSTFLARATPPPWPSMPMASSDSHTEYRRPADNLLMVDLWVSPPPNGMAKMRGSSRRRSARSYRVVCLQGSLQRSDVARPNVTSPRAVVDITEADGALLVKVTGHTNNLPLFGREALGSRLAICIRSGCSLGPAPPGSSSPRWPPLTVSGSGGNAYLAEAAVSGPPSTVKDVTSLPRGEKCGPTLNTGTGPMPISRCLVPHRPDRIVLDIMSSSGYLPPRHPGEPGDVK